MSAPVKTAVQSLADSATGSRVPGRQDSVSAVKKPFYPSPQSHNPLLSSMPAHPCSRQDRWSYRPRQEKNFLNVGSLGT